MSTTPVSSSMIQRLLPALAAVGGAEHAALRGWGRSSGRARRPAGCPDGAGRPRSRRCAGCRVSPTCFQCLAAVVGAVHAVARADVIARGDLAAADIDHVRIGWRHRERADRRGTLAVEQRLPGASGVGGLPHAAAGGADVERVRLRGYARAHRRPAAAERADQSPLQRAGDVARRGCGGGVKRRQRRQQAGEQRGGMEHDTDRHGIPRDRGSAQTIRRCGVPGLGIPGQRGFSRKLHRPPSPRGPGSPAPGLGERHIGRPVDSPHIEPWLGSVALHGAGKRISPAWT